MVVKLVKKTIIEFFDGRDFFVIRAVCSGHGLG
jgi:hypothetical protein